MKTLMEHQNKAFNYAKPKNAIALLMEMRLGKTKVLIRWLHYKNSYRNLVLCPLPVIGDWVRELQSEGVADEDIIILKGSPKKRLELVNTKGEWYLCSYESALALPEILDQNFKALVLDESTKIRKPKAKITKLLRKTYSLFQYRAIATGLPNPEDSLDYFEQLHFVQGEFLGCKNYYEFRMRYYSKYGYDWVPRSGSENKILQAVDKIAFCMTQEEAGIGSKKFYKTLEVEQLPLQKRMTAQIEKDFKFDAVRKNDFGEETKWVPVKYIWMGQVAGGFTPHADLISSKKTDLILELLKGEFKNKKIVIWFKYSAELKHVHKKLIKNSISAIRYDGQSNKDDLAFKVGSIQVICAQAKCGQYGKNWSVADTAIYYSNWYDGEVRAQSEQRIVHPTKKRPLLYIDIITKDTIDEDVVNILKNKKLNASKFMDELAKRWAKKGTNSEL